MQSKILALSLLALSAAARAETTDCTEITSVPYAVNAPGVYCLKSSLSGIGGIGIAADDVTIDLNGHTLEVSSGIGVAAYGNSKNGTVRNGTIRGGHFAVAMISSGSGHLVERIRAEGSGIHVRGDGGVVRNNVVIGSTSANIGPNYGINVHEGAGIRVSDNLIVNPGLGYGGEAGGILALGATGATIERNVVSCAAVEMFSPVRYGIHVSSDGAIVAGNHVVNMRTGITNPTGTSLFLNNTVRGAKTPFFGGVMAGTTNYSF